uniref:non-ribosomal peptide synthetase n=1 Tax=Massilia sp. YIM B04103 TaxID=2963106 RepID=UPI00210B8173
MTGIYGKAGQDPFPATIASLSEQEYPAPAARESDEAFWRQRLPEAAASLFDKKLADDGVAADTLQSWEIDAGLARRIRTLAREQQCAVRDFWLTAFAACLARCCTCDGEIRLGIADAWPDAGDEAAGRISAVLPLTAQLAWDEDTARNMLHVRDELQLCAAHARYPVAQLLREQGRDGHPYDAVLMTEAYAAAGNAPSMAQMRQEQAPLVMALHGEAGGASTSSMRIAFHWDRRRIPAAEVAALRRRLEILARAAAGQDQIALAALPLMETAERQQLLSAWNGEYRNYPLHLGVHELFEHQAQWTPDAVAAEYCGQSLSYRALNEEANRLAHHLRAKGARPDALIALFLERSLEMVVAMLAVLKAGAAYTPLDTAWPQERIDHMLADAAPLLVLTQPHLRPQLKDQPVLDLMDPLALWREQSAANPARGAGGLQPGHLAYVLYTSGSTGTPKGVQIEHRGLTNVISWHCEHLPLVPGERSSALSGVAFDASSWEIWPPLCMGATLVLAPADTAGDALRLLEWWQQQDLQTSFLTTALAEMALERMRHGDSRIQRSLRTLLIGGEQQKMTPDANLPFEVINNYGPTETTILVTSGRSLPQDKVKHIGRPLANTAIYILDRFGQLVPPGAPGEIFIGGAGVARGYLNQETQTRERFLPDPFAGTADARMYKTGDLGRWLADGSIEFLGRNDQQVKLRGLRIELGEIESQLLRQPGVREAVVVVREDHPGDRRLVAYLVASGEESDSQRLREALSRQLPDYMVPAAYMRLDALPLTLNGKIDKRALPAPEDAAYARRGYEAPQGATETALARIWAELLQLERVGRQDHFFELGGHSLLALHLIERMRHEQLHVDSRVLFSHPTLAALARAVDEGAQLAIAAPAVSYGIPADCVTITPQMLPLLQLDEAQIARIAATVPGGAANIQDIYPLAPLQEGILFHHLLQAQGDPYLLVNTWTFDTRARLDGFIAALQQTVARHDALRTAVLWEGLAEPVQVVWREAKLEILFPALSGENTLAELDTHSDPRRVRLDVRQAPLMRGYAACDPIEGRWLLQLLLHHMVLDHAALSLLFQEVAAIQAGREQALPEAIPFRHFVARTRQPGRMQEHEAFFRAILGDVDEPTAPFGLLDVRGDGSAIREAERHTGTELSQRLRRQAREQGVGAASLFHWAWARVLAQCSGCDDVVFGTVLFGRMHGGVDAERTMGLFVNTLPVRIRFGEDGVAQDVRAIHAMLAQLVWHEDAPLSLAQRCTGLAKGVPPFSSLLNYRHSAAAVQAADGKDWGEGVRMLPIRELSNYPFSLRVDDLGQDFKLSSLIVLPVDADRVCGYMLRALEQLADALERAPDTPAWRIGVIGEEEQHSLVEWNATQRSYGGEFAHRQFEQRAAQTPDAVALETEGESWSYQRLNEGANRLAHHLIGLGVKPDMRVALVLERGAPLVLGMLATLKAGGAYVPLDPQYPSERLAFMLDDSRPRVVLTQSSLQELLPASRALMTATVLELDDPAPAWHTKSTDNPAPAGLEAAHLAYVIYTSGSTGRPKGVMVEHRNL